MASTATSSRSSRRTARCASGSWSRTKSDGRKLISQPRTQRVSVKGVARSTHATITVRSLSADGLPGRSVSVTA
jgi:hypothetical protein